MPFEVSWYIERRVIMTKIAGDVDAVALASIAQQQLALLDEGHARVYLMIDARAVETLQFDFARLPLPKTLHPMLGWTVLIHDEKVALYAPILRLGEFFRFGFRSFTSMGEAILFLLEKDSTLKPYRPSHSVQSA